MYALLTIKRCIESVFIFPFIVVGRFVAVINPLKKEYDKFFFFPFFHTGGAENIHAQITRAVGGPSSIIFFTRKSVDNRYLPLFQSSHCTIKDISAFTDNKVFYFLNLIFRGVIMGYINKQKRKPIVFNGQCNFGYKISPWIHTTIAQVELIHSFNSFSFIRIPFISFITKSIMISKKAMADHRQLYLQYKIPMAFYENIIYIPNGISISDANPVKTESNHPFTVLYSGRGSKEKRLHLIIKIAEELNRKHPEIQFEILGNVSNVLDASFYPSIKFWGNQTDEHVLDSIYQNSHILLLTSTTEGFPLVIMEAMAAGCSIIATPVGDIPLHIKNGENGLLLSSISNEKLIIEESMKYIVQLQNEKELLHKIAQKNIHYAQTHFQLQKMQSTYQTLFKELTTH